MAKVGFGIVGLGIWGETHLMTYSTHPDVELVKICDLNEKRARKMARQYGVKEYCTDYRELVEDPRISAVSIVTPDFAHTEIAIAAANAGKHILCEKPLATTVRDCQAIINAARKNRVKLMVDFHNHWNPPVHRIKEAVENGDVGTPLFMSLRLNDTIEVPRDWLSWAGKSSALWFLGSHSVDLVRWIFNDEIVRVYCVSRSKVLKKLGVNTPDFYATTLELRKGGVALLENGWILSEKCPFICEFKIELVGSEGTMYSDITHHRASQKYTRKEAGYLDVFARPEILGKPSGFAIESIKHFVDCVVNDRKPLITGEDGLATTKVIVAMMKSARLGRPVKVN